VIRRKAVPHSTQNNFLLAALRFASVLLVAAVPFTLVGHGSNLRSQEADGIPSGFQAIFNGKDTNGWHFSRTSHHGTTAKAYVENGELVLKQQPFGQGGLLLTDKKYHNFELYVEVKEAWGCNSGLFLRSTEGGSAYQIELDQSFGNGNLLGELMRVSKPARAATIGEVWKTDDWNSFRVRMQGDAPHITLWVNGAQMWDVEEPKNDKIAGETDGEIGLQLHWSSTYQPELAQAFKMLMWKPDAAYRFRNVAVKELP
jgi:Domain of Unknown Function (DUF1080)